MREKYQCPNCGIVFGPGDWYREQIEKNGLLARTEKWLKENPPPKKWQQSRWAWAYTEMVVIGPFTL